MDYESLKAAIQSWSERTYDDAQLDEFIDNAEAQIRRRLVGYRREITTTFTTDAGGKVALPADFIAMRSVYLGIVPYRYSLSGDFLTIQNGASQTFDVVYYGTLPALDGTTTTTNWLLRDAQDVYLLLCEAQQRAFEEEFSTAAGLESSGLAKLDELGLQNTVAQYGRQGLTLPVRAA